MSSRDLFWRTLGVLIIANAFVATRLAADHPSLDAIAGVVGFVCALVGLVFAVQGERLINGISTELRNHRGSRAVGDRNRPRRRSD